MKGLFGQNPDCLRCLSFLARDAAEMAAQGDDGLFQRACEKALGQLEDCFTRRLASPQIANRMLKAVRDVTGVRDPYENFKAREMERALAAFKRLRVPADFEGLIYLAAAGNSLDFFNEADDPLSSVALGSARKGLFIDHAPKLKEFLAGRPGLVLYLTDNAGEIYFDAPLFNYLRSVCERAVLVPKGGPAVNDLTREELLRSGLDIGCWEIADTGTEGAGIEWDWASDDFKRLLREADLVVSKGMANFETLYQVDLDCPVFFLFKVKCRPIRDYLRAPLGGYVALWREKTDQSKGRLP